MTLHVLYRDYSFDFCTYTELRIVQIGSTIRTELHHSHNGRVKTFKDHYRDEDQARHHWAMRHANWVSQGRDCQLWLT